MNDEFFTTSDEAYNLIGSRVMVRVAWGDIPEGATGRVKFADESAGHWDVAVEWDMPDNPVTWLTKGEYTRYLQLWEADP